MDRYRIGPKATVDLDEHDPEEHPLADDEDDAVAKTEALAEELGDLQQLLYGECRHKLLVVLQAMDTGGKDGVIRHVLGGLNPAGLRVTSFKAPTDDELAHDYLWRVHAHVPMAGEIGVFNRSHYEDVLVVRVHDLVPKKQWKKRYGHITAFEQMLADEGTTIVKLFLHISEDEQKRRLQARLDDPNKRWKFKEGDLEERKLWDDYQEAYAEAITRTSTALAPWHIVPADHKWYRDLVVTTILVDTLKALGMAYPEPADLDGIVVT